jgi:uncharacterized membrane protein YGL010W
MSQRLQSIFFFLSALMFALLFFFPLAEFDTEKNILVFNVFGFETKTPDAIVPFSKMFALPVLVLTLTAVLLGGYLAMGLFRAVKLAQFQKLLKTARVDVFVIVAWIIVFVGYMYFIVPKSLNDTLNGIKPNYWIVILPVVSLILTIFATISLKKDIKKVRSTDRIR